MNRKTTILCLLTFLCFSCSDELIDTNVVNSNENFEIRSINGFLEFQSVEVFQKTMEELKGKTPAEVVSWTKQFADYNSIAEIYEKSVESDNAYFEKMNSLSQEEISKIDFSDIDRKVMHSEYLLKHKEYFKFSEEGDFQLKIAVPFRYYPILNMEGIVKVGNSIYKFYENQEKIILDGDIKKLAIIDKVEEDMENIKVYDTFAKNLKIDKNVTKNAVELWDPNWTFHCCNKNGNYRVRTIIKVFYLNSIDACPSVGGKFEMTFIAKNQKDGLFGWDSNTTKQLAIQITSLNVTANLPGSLIISTPALYKPGITASEIRLDVWETGCSNYVSSSINLQTLSIDGVVSYHGENFTHCINASTNC